MPIQFASGRKVLIPIAAILFVALLPQLFFMLAVGKWYGSYFVSNYDEPAYSAYVNGLIHGEPRKHDPFLGLSDSPTTPQPETLYSIQFIPAYAIAVPARVLGVSVSTAFILLAAFIAIFSAIVIYILLFSATEDGLLATVGPIIVLCFGTALALQGELRVLIDGRVLADFLPFLRRYQPGFAFPLFFVFCLLFYKAANRETTKATVTFAIGAGVVFAILVFSYFYLWTAAAAWLACFAIIYLIVRRSQSRNVLIAAGVVAGFAAIVLVPYFSLLSQRSVNLDSVQLLDLTRMPQFDSPSMIVGLIVAAAAIVVSRRSGEPFGSSLILLLSLALTPVILFNQQVITGRSLQPVHYELFIANYMVLTAAVMLIGVLKPDRTSEKRNRFLVYLAIAAFAWGSFESFTSANRSMTVAEIRDGSLPAIRAAAADKSRKQVIVATNFVTADIIPSVPNAVSFWNAHTSSAGGIGVEENKRRFYRYLYFAGYTGQEVNEALRAKSFEVTAAIFGGERALPVLSSGTNEITESEITAEAANYAAFVKTFSAGEAYASPLDHIIAPSESETTFENLDRWYTRDQGQEFGLFRLYRLTPKK